MTKFELFVQRWENCTKCELHETRDKIVLSRGKIPADVVMVGEAPGESENLIGSPFIGPAGKLLDFIVAQAVPTELRIAFTNLVCCIPRNEEEGGKLKEPPDNAISKCEPRLMEFIELCKPKYLISVGKLATKYLRHERVKDLVNYGAISHPAYILRLPDQFDRDYETKRAIVVIRDTLEGTYK